MNASQILIADSWKTVHPGARVGLLALSGAANPERHEALDERKREIEEELRRRLAGKSKADLAALETIRAYTAFYKPFNKTYHVLLQLESVALKGKSLSSATALVQAMFMAEVEHQLLTAGHDLEKVAPPVTIAASRGDETYTRINGSPQTLKTGDMFMHDADGILSSVIYGPDRRTQITGETRRVLYVTYAPRGIAGELLRTHLDRLEQYMRLVSPGAAQEFSGVWGE